MTTDLPLADSVKLGLADDCGWPRAHANPAIQAKAGRNQERRRTGESNRARERMGTVR